MTKWIRMSNKGNFDVVTAIGMMGASVKTCDNPIGLYGSGVKYAMAQALRTGVALKIADNGKLYSLTAKETVFRGETFQNVTLKEKSGKCHKTGITSDFGKEDWNDPWFIFREFYSNMLDEKGTCEVVDGIQVSDSGVDVFLPYALFKEFVENLDDYFCYKTWTMRSGTGRVFKRGVYVGTLEEDPGLDMQSDTVEITETRTMNQSSAWRGMVRFLEFGGTTETLTEIFSKPDCWGMLDSLWLGSHALIEKVHQALLNVFGDSYVLCPNVDWIKKDAREVYGRDPICVPVDWTMPATVVHTMKDLSVGIIFREASKEERQIIDRGLKALSWMDNVPDSHGSRYKVSLSDMNVQILKTEENCGGLAKRGTTEIAINAKVIAGPFEKFVQTLMHECIHAITGAGDYTREFPAFMERALASMSV